MVFFLQMLKKSAPYVRVAQVDCQMYQGVCRMQQVDSYPTIRLYPMGYQGSDRYQ